MMAFDMWKADMTACAGVFVVHEPHGYGKKTVIESKAIPVMICSWWRTDGVTGMVGIVSQSFQ